MIEKGVAFRGVQIFLKSHLRCTDFPVEVYRFSCLRCTDFPKKRKRVLKILDF